MVTAIDENGKPDAQGDAVKFGGWHTIEKDRIYDENTPLGFWAYLELSKK